MAAIVSFVVRLDLQKTDCEGIFACHPGAKVRAIISLRRNNLHKTIRQRMETPQPKQLTNLWKSSILNRRRTHRGVLVVLVLRVRCWKSRASANHRRVQYRAAEIAPANVRLSKNCMRGPRRIRSTTLIIHVRISRRARIAMRMASA